MKADGSDVKDKLKSTEVAKRDLGMKEWLESLAPELEKIIPANTISATRLLKSAALEIANNPKLGMCTRSSIKKALWECGEYGLEPGSLLGRAWFIPYNKSVEVSPGKWEKQMTCHFQLGFKGWVEFLHRSDTVKDISAEVVYDNDIFDVELGMGRHLTHKIDIRKERGEPIAYYCLVELTNEGKQFSVMSRKDIERHRDRFSKAHNSAKTDGKPSIWDTDMDAMGIKTVIIRASKLCPISIEAMSVLAKAIQNDSDKMRDVTPKNTVETKDIGFEDPPGGWDTIAQDWEADEEPSEQTEPVEAPRSPQSEPEKPKRGRPPKDSGVPIATPPPEEKQEDMGLF